jgi:competence protein ComGB
MRMALSLKRLVRRENKLPEEIQLRFLNQLHRFLSNGYPLQQSLEALAWDKDLAHLASYFLTQLKQGEKLDVIFKQTGFHSTIYTFLYFVHANSNLINAIEKCTEIVEQRFKNTKKFRSTIRYPFLLLVIFMVMLIFINQEILPAFQLLLQSSEEALVTVTILKVLLDLIQYSLFISVFLSILFAMIWRRIREKIPIEEQIKFLKKIPIYHRYLTVQTSFQFATHFTSLLQAGLSLKEILQELKKQDHLPIISHYADLLTSNLERGFHISYCLEELYFIEKQLAVIFQKNANITILKKDLTLYSELLLEEMQRIIIRTLTVIQPIFYVVIGGFIIFIYFVLMWPMFQLINTF